MARILVVEDEVAIARGLCDCLQFHEHEVQWEANGQAGLERALSGDFDLLLLDVMLPDLDGFSICQQLRTAQPAQAIVMLTAKGSEADILHGFAQGADDYICKPFSVAQLVARIDALLRRRTAQPIADQDEEQALVDFTIGSLQITIAHLRACNGERQTDLNRRDIEILSILNEEPGRIVSRRRLLHDVWGFVQPDAIETRSVDMHIAKLRKKIQPLLKRGGIETVRGEGYRWTVA